MAEANGAVKSEEAFTQAETLVKLLLSLDKHEARRLFGRLNSQLVDVGKTWGHLEVLAEGMKYLERAIALRNRMREFIDPAEACHKTMNALVTRLVTSLESREERPGDVQCSTNDIQWEFPILECVNATRWFHFRDDNLRIAYRNNLISLVEGEDVRTALMLCHNVTHQSCIVVLSKTQPAFVRLIAVPTDAKDLNIHWYQIRLEDASLSQATLWLKR
ncbi:MAG: hypothetical protein Q9183_003810 [Haloplaca sp. 2 TL-2023]